MKLYRKKTKAHPVKVVRFKARKRTTRKKTTRRRRRR